VLAHTLRTVSSPNRADTHTHTRTATKPELGRRKSKFQQRKRCRIFLWRLTLTGQAQSFALFTAAQRCQNTHHTRTQVCTQTCAQQSATKPELGRRESKHSSGSAAKKFFTLPRPNPNWAGASTTRSSKSAADFSLTRPNPNWAGAKATHSSGSAAEFYFLFDQTQTGQAKPFNPKQ
jgi:hypothetical protein